MNIKTLISLIGTYSSVIVPPPTGGGYPYVTTTPDTITIHASYKVTYKTSTTHASYDTSKRILRVWGNKFRVWMVEKNYVAEIDVSSLSYSANNIIGLYTSYIDSNGISKLSIETTNTFTETYSVSYSTALTIGLGSTISYGLDMLGLEKTTSQETVESCKFERTEQYSSTFSSSVSKNVDFNLDEDLSNYYVTLGVVADVLKGKVTTYLEEHWFYGSYKAELNENKDFEFLTNIHDSVVYKNKSTGEETTYHL